MSAETRGLSGTLGVIAGGGSLPALLLDACDRQGIKTFVVAFPGHTDPALYAGRPHLLMRPGRAGRIIAELRRQGAADLTWIGSLRRPSLAELRPDWRAARFFASIAWRALGDDGLLRAVKAEVEREGFRFHAVQNFVAGLVGPAGNLGAMGPAEEDGTSIARGFAVLKATGGLDIGQALIVQQGNILGVEAAEGTDELIRRCAAYKRRGRGGILVKASKSGQDRDSDLPTIGPRTVELAAETGLAGIVFQAGHTLLADAQAMAEIADRRGLFITGMDHD